MTGYAGKAASFTGASDQRFYAADLSAKVGAFDVYGTYYKIDAEKDIVATKEGKKVANVYPAFDQDIYV